MVLMQVAMSAKAQYDAAFSHYFDMETSFNPAAAGKESRLNVNLAYALNFTGFEHNPRTMYAAADMPFYLMRSYHGVGLQFLNEKIGLFTHQKLALQYAHQLACNWHCSMKVSTVRKLIQGPLVTLPLPLQISMEMGWILVPDSITCAVCGM